MSILPTQEMPQSWHETRRYCGMHLSPLATFPSYKLPVNAKDQMKVSGAKLHGIIRPTHIPKPQLHNSMNAYG